MLPYWTLAPVVPLQTTRSMALVVLHPMWSSRIPITTSPRARAASNLIEKLAPVGPCDLI
jgi:hypothetical protein